MVEPHTRTLRANVRPEREFTIILKREKRYADGTDKKKADEKLLLTIPTRHFVIIPISSDQTKDRVKQTPGYSESCSSRA